MTDLDDEVGSPAEEFKAFAADTGMNRSQSEYCNVGVKTYLTNHPAKKFVFDFMRVLIIDNLCLTPASKQTPLIDLLLEASPERSTRTQQKEFQTYILDSVMDHLLAADVLLGNNTTFYFYFKSIFTLLLSLKPKCISLSSSHYYFSVHCPFIGIFL